MKFAINPSVSTQTCLKYTNQQVRDFLEGKHFYRFLLPIRYLTKYINLSILTLYIYPSSYLYVCIYLSVY